MDRIRVGILVFPQVQQLDLTGPFEVFASAAETEVRLLQALMAAPSCRRAKRSALVSSADPPEKSDSA